MSAAKILAATGVIVCALMASFHWANTRNKDAAGAWFVAATWATAFALVVG